MAKLTQKLGAPWAKFKANAWQQADEQELAQVPYPVTDVVAMYPQAQPLYVAAAAGDWPAIQAFLAGLEDPRDREWAVDEIILIDGVGPMLAAAADADPGSTSTAALYGARLVLDAWAVRGSGPASSVGREQFDAFHEILRRAEGVFLDVLARDPADNTVGRWRNASAMGLGLGQGEIMRRYENFAVHHPYSVPAQTGVLTAILPKWGGSWDAASAFATRCALAAPPGSANGALVPTFHLERWVSLADDEESASYFLQPAVHNELIRAAEHSVLHPAFRRRLGWVGACGSFQMCFGLARDHQRLGPLFDLTGDFMNERQWGVFAKPSMTFRTYRLRALHAAGRL